MTGSSTIRRAPWRFKPSATVSMTAGWDSMPIFTAATSRSEKTESICVAMKSAGTSKMP